MSWLVPSIGFPHASASHLEMTLHSSLLSVTCPMSLGAVINLYKKQLAMQGSCFPFFFLWPSSEA